MTLQNQSSPSPAPNRKDPLLQPFTLKGLTLRNRIMSTSHAPGYVVDGRPQERYRLYHREKARGGLALSSFGGSTNVAPDSPSVFGQINAGDDGIIPHFQALADAVHGEGAAIFCQITHMGRRTVWNNGDWLPVVAPSRVREPAHRAFPKEMDQADIDRITRAYGDAARRCQEGGLDGVEVLCHGHLVEQFWSPKTNKRTDGYGGDLKNRMRFSLEVLQQVRDAVGPDYIVGVRIGSDSLDPEDLTLEDNLEIAEILEQTGLVDFMNLNRGHIDSNRGLAHMMPGMADPLAVHLQTVCHFRSHVKLPLFHACRVNDMATARYAISENLVDMVGMTRGHMADPHITNKLARGEEDRIRPCVGAGYCIDRLYEAGEALCLHNAATGREATMPHVIPAADGPAKKVVVVGGGPAGLEAARVSAERGHEVMLFEATSQLGGQLALAAKAGWRADLISVVRWMENELDHLGVTVKTNAYAEADDVLAEQPDVVVIATGGTPDPILEEREDLVTSTWDVLSGAASISGSVLLYDDHGQHHGPSCAQFLAERGCQVELATPDRMAAAELGAINYPIHMEKLYGLGVKMTPDLRLRDATRKGNQIEVTLVNEYSDRAETRLVDHLVVEHGTLPMEDLYHDLQARAANQGQIDYDALIAGRPQKAAAELGTNGDGQPFVLYRVGDAVSSRNAHAAIYDSLRLCKDL